MKREITLLVIALVTIALSVFLSIDSAGSVYLGNSINISIPGSCVFKSVTNVECPFCGLTRGFVSIGHFQISKALSYNYLSGVLFLFVIFQIPYRLLRLKSIMENKKKPDISLTPKMNYLLISTTVILWLIRIMDVL